MRSEKAETIICEVCERTAPPGAPGWVVAPLASGTVALCPRHSHPTPHLTCLCCGAAGRLGDGGWMVQAFGPDVRAYCPQHNAEGRSWLASRDQAREPSRGPRCRCGRPLVEPGRPGGDGVLECEHCLERRQESREEAW